MKQRMKVFFVVVFLSCSLYLLPVLSRANQITSPDLHCETLSSRLTGKNLPRLLSGEGKLCQWFHHLPTAANALQDILTTGLWPVLNSLEWFTMGFPAWAEIWRQALQPSQPDKRFSGQYFEGLQVTFDEPNTLPEELKASKELKASLIPDNLPPWQQQELSGQWQRLHLNLPDIEIAEAGQVRIYISIVDQRIRIALRSSSRVSRQRLMSFNSALHEFLLALYQIMLEQEPVDDIQADDYRPMVSAPGGGGDGDDNGDDGFSHDDNLPEIILDFNLLPGLLSGTAPELLTDSILKQRALLRRLHQRLDRAIARGDSTMAAILRDRIMVIEANEEDFLNLATAPDTNNQKILALLQSLDADWLTPGDFDPGNYLRQIPVSGGKTKSSSSYSSRYEAAGTSHHPLRSRKHSRQSTSGNGQDDDGGKDLPPTKKRDKASQEPEIICSACNKPIPKNEPKVKSSVNGKIYCRECYPGFVLLPPELFFLVISYFEWNDLVHLSMTCKSLQDFFWKNPEQCILGPLMRKMGLQSREVDKQAYGSEEDIIKRLGQYGIPDSVITLVTSSGSSLYLQAFHNFLLRHKPLKYQGKFSEARREIILCLELLPNGQVACGLESGEINIRNYEIKEAATRSALFRVSKRIPFPQRARKEHKTSPVISINLLSDERLLVAYGSRDDMDIPENYYLAADKVIKRIALCDTETCKAHIIFPQAGAIESDIKAMVVLADHRLVFFNSQSSQLHVWNINKDQEQELFTLTPSSAVVRMLSLEQQPSLISCYTSLISCYISGEVKIWSVQQGHNSNSAVLISAPQASRYKLELMQDHHMKMIEIFSERRLLTASPGHVVAWNMTTIPARCMAHLNLKDVFGYRRADLHTGLARHPGPKVQSWVELADHRLAILFQWCEKELTRTALIFWDTGLNTVTHHFDSKTVYQNIPAPNPEEECPSDYYFDHYICNPDKIDIHMTNTMMPLLGHHLMVASERSVFSLWQTVSGKEDVLASGNIELFDGGECLHPILIKLPGNRILGCFGGKYLALMHLFSD